MDLEQLITETLKEKIQEKGLKYKEFAELTGFQRSYISKIINGETKKIAVQTLERLLEPLQMTLTEFFAEIDKKKLLLMYL